MWCINEETKKNIADELLQPDTIMSFSLVADKSKLSYYSNYQIFLFLVWEHPRNKNDNEKEFAGKKVYIFIIFLHSCISGD